MTDTLSYYDQHARDYAESTVGATLNKIEDRFLSYLEPGASILDFGCGSGRDTRHFLEKGYCVTAIDGSAELCRIASEYTGIAVKQMLFQDLSDRDLYDGIWACSSILHLPMAELIKVMQKLSDALRDGGVLYTSFKYGSFEGERHERYFTDMDEERMEALISHTPSLEIVDCHKSFDVRPGREDEQWINVIIKKQKPM